LLEEEAMLGFGLVERIGRVLEFQVVYRRKRMAI